ncbi:MAG: HAD family hydrolase [Sporichthyaceae bacterium]|nr:HAD family hydrolase [Sporichthyaceae bacterium]
MTVEAVIFDWGGTLTPWHTIDLREQWRHYAEMYDPGRADELSALILSAEDDAWRAGREHQRSATLEEIFRSVGVEPSGERHERALAAYHAFWEPHTYTDPDVPELFAGLTERGVRIGVLSNTLWTRAHHEEVFRRDGVLDLIDGAVYSSELPFTKPHPQAFRAAMDAVGVGDPARVVFVGDRPYDDIHGAKEAGMRAVLVPHSAIPAVQKGHVEGDPDAVVQRLLDVLGVVDRWNA